MCFISMNLPKISYIHRNKAAGYSIDKVTQTIIRGIKDKEERYVPYAVANIKGIINNILYCWKLRKKEQIYHITGDIHYCLLSFVGCKTVLTIHDTVPLDYLNYGLFKRIVLKWLWYKIPLLIATKVVCISEETKRCVERYTSRRDIEVIHNAIDPSFHKIEKNVSLRPKKILLIGTAPNKNLERTIEALKDIDCELTIIGKPSEAQMAKLRSYRITYNVKTGLTDQQIIEEYANADVVSFISLFEGFGMIVIEANAVGRPVITSNIPVIKEVAGNAALFVDPTDIEDIKKGFIKLFDDAELRKSLVDAGFENVKRFEVKAILNQWRNLYDSIK